MQTQPQQLRILVINNEYPPLGGGAGVCTRYQSEGWANQMGHQVSIITSWYKGQPAIEENGNLTIYRIVCRRKHDFQSNPIEMLSFAFAAKKFLNQHLISHSYHICIAHYALPSGWVAKYAYQHFKLPYSIISHGHDIPFAHPKQMLKYHLPTYFWLKSIFSKAKRTVLLTTEMKQMADNFLGENYSKKNIVIPNGCHSASFYPDESKKNKQFTILFAGRLVTQKDPLTFLKAIRILKETKPDISFKVNILGDGPMRRQMENFVVKNHLSGCVTFHGWVNKATMLAHYQASSLQIISSIYEAMSIAALEALSCGLYLISTPVSGNNELIIPSMNGQLVPFKNPDAIASNLAHFYENKFTSKYKIPEGETQNLRCKFDWANINQQYESIIRQVVSQ
ncbi:MAG: glycosyltransferase [Sphingobacteriales bacterium]|nr:glycosyltransferase [Sphingobacteriales bacterium]